MRKQISNRIRIKFIEKLTRVFKLLFGALRAVLSQDFFLELRHGLRCETLLLTSGQDMIGFSERKREIGQND